METAVNQSKTVNEKSDWFKYRSRNKDRVLLREPERCMECGSVFISLYPLKKCEDHTGLDVL